MSVFSEREDSLRVLRGRLDREIIAIENERAPIQEEVDSLNSKIEDLNMSRDLNLSLRQRIANQIEITQKARGIMMRGEDSLNALTKETEAALEGSE